MADITPRIDLVFKKIFGVEENKDLLISLLNAVLSQEDQVSSVEILNPYNLQNFKEEKLSILDIKARGQTGHYYNIEVQVTDAKDYEKRALFYWAKLYTSQLAPKGLYNTLQKTIGIHILNFTSIPSVKEYHNTFHLQPDSDEEIACFQDIELHTIELSKFGATSPDLDEKEELRLLLPQVKTALDRWAAFLSKFYLFKGEPLPQQMEFPEVKKALETLEVMRLTKEEREIYENHLKWFRDEASALEKTAETSFQNGLEEGRKEGIEIGIEKGERNKAVAVAKTLLQKGIDIAIVAEASGLSVMKLQVLQKEPSTS